MPNIKKILFPVDFSDSCYSAVRYVEFFAGQFEAEIMLLHVVGMGNIILPRSYCPEGRHSSKHSWRVNSSRSTRIAYASPEMFRR